MTPKQLARIPEPLRIRRLGYGCRDLILYLRIRGLQMTLLELEQERTRRGIDPRRKRWWTR